MGGAIGPQPEVGGSAFVVRAGDRLGGNISGLNSIKTSSQQVVDVLAERPGVQRGLIEVREWIPMLFCDSFRAREASTRICRSSLVTSPRGRGAPVLGRMGASGSAPG